MPCHHEQPLVVSAVLHDTLVLVLVVVVVLVPVLVLGLGLRLGSLLELQCWWQLHGLQTKLPPPGHGADHVHQHSA